VTRIDPGELSLKVKQRMDELFPDAEHPPAGAEAPGGAGVYALAASRRIVKSLEPTSQMGRIRDYLNELIRLQGVFARDLHLRAVIQVQIALCRYLIEHPDRLERRALELLAEGFGGLERLNAADPMPVEEKERLIQGLTKAVKAWKQPPPAAPAVPEAEEAAETASGSPRRAVPGAYYLIPVEDIDELKRFFQREMARLRAEVSGRRRTP